MCVGKHLCDLSRMDEANSRNIFFERPFECDPSSDELSVISYVASGLSVRVMNDVMTDNDIN